MAVRIESQAEPIPGYRLLERLGGGGFGEVWKCEAPGGLHKAIKFVYGDLDSHDEEGARAEQEHRSLARIQNVRHPYILSLERYDIIDGQLIIVMELADRTLWDRFKECRTQGNAGIPRAELLGYMRETAEALDLMLSEYQLQHLDIKPQNLFLVHKHVKVADFGLVKVLEKQIASVTGGVTPVYAAPETFDGYVSRFSDQYSLAIVYQELLTGKRPFDGGTMRQLILQHLQAPPDLKPLPDVDRESIGRALAKSPDGRFPTCKAFIDSLFQSDRPAETPVIPAPRRALDSFPPPAIPAFDPQQTQSGPGLPSLKGDKRPAFRASAPPTLTIGETGAIVAAKGDEPSLSASESQPLLAENDNMSVGVSAIGRLAAGQGTVSPATIANGFRKPVPEVTGDGILSPTLVVGLGFLGLCAIKQLRQEVHEQFGGLDSLPHLRFLYLDTDPEAPSLAARGAKETALQQGEVLLAKLRRPSHYLKGRFGKECLEAILPSQMLYRITRQQTTAGVRALGRLALVDNYRAIVHRLESELRDCCEPEALQKAAELTGLGIRGGLPRVYVVTSLSGGTGSGMFIDVAYLLRHLLRKLGAERAEIIGLLLAPPVTASARQTPALANTYAALRELVHFGHPASGFQAHYDNGESSGGPKHFVENGPVFQRALVLPFAEQAKDPPPLEEGADCLTGLTQDARRLIGLAGHYLFTDLASPLSRAAEQARKQQQATSGSAGRNGCPEELNVQAMGMYRILWPRRQLLARTAASLCHKLVQRWMTKDAKPLRDIVQDWVRKQWDEIGLGQDKLIARLQQACETALQRSPEEVFAALVVSVAPPPPPHAKKKDLPRATPPQLGAVVEALDQLEKILGIPDECKQVQPGQPSLPPGFLEQSLRDATATAVREYEQIMAEVIVRLIETPDYRLAGAEETIRQFSQLIQQALESHEQLGKELLEKSAIAYKRLHAFVEWSGRNNSPSTSSRNTPFSRSGPTSPAASAADIAELLKVYSKCRLQGLVLDHLHQLYVALRGLLSDQLREVDYCRARLSDLAHIMEQPAQAAPFSNAPAAGRCLFPEGCANLNDAVKQLETSLTADQHRELDQRMQAMFKQQFRALVHVCTSSANVIKTVAPAVLHQAQAFLSERLGPANVAEMYLNQHEIKAIRDGKTTFPMKEDLRAAFGKAAPAFQEAGHAEELCLFGIPPGQGQDELQQRVLDALPEAKLTALASSEEVLFYRELNHIHVSELPQIGPTAEEAYRKMCDQDQFTPHSRADITDWLGVNLRRTLASAT